MCASPTYFDDLESDDVIRTISVNLLENIYVSARCPAYLQFFSAVKLNLFMDVLFMLLRTSDTERQKFENEPTEFTALLQDTCET